MEKISDSVIIVGNGASLLRWKMGCRIDHFDIVVRLNNFQIRGYEPFVGTRTTIWARNNMFDIRERDASEIRSVLVYVPLSARAGAYRKYPVLSLLGRWATVPAQELAERYPVCETVDSRIVARVEEEMGIASRRWQCASTGLIAIAHAVDRFQKVTIHGFDHFRLEDKRPRHYFGNRERARRSFAHDPAKERAYVQTLISRGFVQRLVEEDGSA